MLDRSVARDITYSHSAQSIGAKALVSLLENSTGRLGLIRRARGYENDMAQGADFWSAIMNRFGLTIDVMRGSFENIPQTGPLVVVANHPYGILDGLTLGHILAQRRGDFRILANAVFKKAETLNNYLVPIDFAPTRAAQMANIETRNMAQDYLAQGGAIGIFPGGTVSTAAKPFSQPLDPSWRGFTAKMIQKSRPTVVPIYFDGHTSRLFQLASHLHYSLRMGLLIKEFKRRVDTPVRISIGTPMAPETFDIFRGDPAGLMDFLRQTTYSLSSERTRPMPYGYEFEAKYRKRTGTDRGNRHL